MNLLSLAMIVLSASPKGKLEAHSYASSSIAAMLPMQLYAFFHFAAFNLFVRVFPRSLKLLLTTNPR
jgi:hypothetical protein